MERKGVSAVVATVLIILITIAGVTILWTAVIPMIKTSVQGSEACDNAEVSMVTSGGYTCYDEMSQVFGVQVGRGTKDVNVSGVVFYVTIGGETSTFTGNFSLGKSESKTVYLNLSGLAYPERVSVAPIVEFGGSRKTCEDVNVISIASLSPCAPAALLGVTSVINPGESGGTGGPGPGPGPGGNSTLFLDGGETWTHNVNCPANIGGWDSCSAADPDACYVQSVSNGEQTPAVGSYYIMFYDVDVESNTYLRKEGLDTSSCSSLWIEFYTSSGDLNDAGEGCRVSVDGDGGASYTEYFDSEDEGSVPREWFDGNWHYKSVDITAEKSADMDIMLHGWPTYTRNYDEWCHWDDVKVICGS